VSKLALLPCLGVFLLATAGAALAGDGAFHSPHHYTLRVPQGWEQIDDAVVRQASRLASSAMRMKTQAYEAAFQREDAEHPFAYPYVLVRFEPGNTSGAYRDLEHQIDVGIDEARQKHGKALEEHLGEFSFDRPTVDRTRNRVWITMNAETPADGPVRAFLAAHLGREGVAQLACYTSADDAEAGYRDFVALSDSLTFDEGYTFRAGGLFDGVLGKALIGAIVGAGIFLVRRVGRRRSAVPPPLPTASLPSAHRGPPEQELAPAFRYVSTRARPPQPVAAGAPSAPGTPGSRSP
jgi:hypothetical protein